MLGQILIKDKLFLWLLSFKILKHKGFYILSLLNIKLQTGGTSNADTINVIY